MASRQSGGPDFGGPNPISGQNEPAAHAADPAAGAGAVPPHVGAPVPSLPPSPYQPESSTAPDGPGSPGPAGLSRNKKALLVTLAAGGVVLMIVGVVLAATLLGQRGNRTTADTSATGPQSGEPPEPIEPSAARVIVDGKIRNRPGPLSCVEGDYQTAIHIGRSGSKTSMIIQIGTSDLVVTYLDVGEVDGVQMGFISELPGGGNASAVKDGLTYTITGVAIGYDPTAANPEVSKPFTITVTCPRLVKIP